MMHDSGKPGALVRDTGADLQSWWDWIDTNLHRESSARGLLQAVLACDPRDRVPLLERFTDALRAGQPTAGFGPIVAEAAFWADWASTAELKAYLLACYTRMSVRDQRAFLGHVQGRAAA